MRATCAFYGLERRITRGSGAPLPSTFARRGGPALKALLPLSWILLLAACGNSGPPDIGPQGLYCVDDSQGCISARSAALNQFMTDKDRAWVRQPAPVAAYASGVRLFAFKQRKRELTCEELAIGRREADAGPAILRGTDGKILTTTQVARGIMLSQEVSRELSAEMKKRCKT